MKHAEDQDGFVDVDLDNGVCQIGGSKGLVELYNLYNIDPKNAGQIIPTLRSVPGLSYSISFCKMDNKGVKAFLKKLITRATQKTPKFREIMGVSEDTGTSHAEDLEMESKLGAYSETYRQIYDEGENMISLVVSILLRAEDDDTLATLAEKLEDEMALYANVVKAQFQQKAIEDVLSFKVDPSSHQNVAYLTSPQFIELLEPFPRKKSQGKNKHLIGYENDEAVTFNLEEYPSKVLILEGPPNTGKTYLLSLLQIILHSLKTKMDFLDIKGPGDADLVIESIFKKMKPNVIIKYGTDEPVNGVNVLEMFKDPEMNEEFIDGFLMRMGFENENKAYMKEMICELRTQRNIPVFRKKEEPLTLLSLKREVEKRLKKDGSKNLQEILNCLKMWTDGSIEQMFCSTTPIDMDEASIVYHDLSEVHKLEPRRMITEMVFLRNIVLMLKKGIGRRAFTVDEAHMLAKLESKWVDDDAETMVTLGRAYDFWSIFALQLLKGVNEELREYITGNASAVFRLIPKHKGLCHIEFADGETQEVEIAAAPEIHKIITGSLDGSKQPEKMKMLGDVAYKEDLEHVVIPRTRILLQGIDLNGKKKVFVVKQQILYPQQAMDIFQVKNILKDMDINYSIKAGIITCDSLDMSIYVPRDEPTVEELRLVSDVLDSLGEFRILADTLPEGTPAYLRDLQIPRAAVESFILENIKQFNT